MSRAACIAALSLLWASGCTCAEEPELGALPPLPAPAADEARGTGDEPEWPTVAVDGLPPVTPATLVVVERHRIEVSNHELVATWPAGDLERARADAPPGALDWPRVRETLEEPSAEGESYPALQRALELARRAQVAGSGAGAGGGVFNLRVAGDVPFEAVERVLYTSGLAAYGRPRLLLMADDGHERMMPWPESRGSGPSAAQLAQLFAQAPEEGEEAPVEPPPPPREARLVLGVDRVEAYVGGALSAPGCERDASPEAELTYDADVSSEVLGTCIERLRARVDVQVLSLAVDRAIPFARLSPVLQHARAHFARVRTFGR